MSVTAESYEPIYLVTITWPGGQVYRLNTSGRDITHGGNTFVVEHADGGSIIELGPVGETPGEYPSRELALAITPWITNQIVTAPASLQRLDVLIQEAATDVQTGVLTVYPVIWRMKSSVWNWATRADRALDITLVIRQELDRFPNAHATLSPASADKLRPGDRAFDMTGARVTSWNSDSPVVPGGPGGGPFFPAPQEWDYGPMQRTVAALME